MFSHQGNTNQFSNSKKKGVVDNWLHTHPISIPSIYDSSPRLKRFMEGTFARIQNEFAPNQILLKTQ